MGGGCAPAHKPHPYRATVKQKPHFRKYYSRDFQWNSKLSSSAANPSAASNDTRLLFSSAAPVVGRIAGGAGVAAASGPAATVGVAGPIIAKVTPALLLLGSS